MKKPQKKQRDKSLDKMVDALFDADKENPYLGQTIEPDADKQDKPKRTPRWDDKK
jgi:hypothetical protein